MHLQVVLPKNNVQGFAKVKIQKITKAKWNGFQVTGKLVQLKQKNLLLAKNIPVSFSMKEIDPKAGYIEGEAMLINHKHYREIRFTKPQIYRRSFTNSLHWIKQKIADRIDAAFSTKLCKDFFKATFLGYKATDQLQFLFQRSGLLHILAISGFHFGLISLCLHFILRFIFSSYHVAILQVATLSLYYFMLGHSPSVFRAYILIITFYLGILLCKKVNIVNSLCFAFFLEILIHPYSIFQMGMQLSYLITLSLICFYTRWKKSLLKSIPKHSLSLMDQHFAIILALFLKGLSLCICAHIITIPLVLYHLQEFHFLSVIYNFFMPQLLSLCMVGALFTLGFPCLPQGIDFITKQILSLIQFLPQRLDFALYVFLPGWIVGILLTGLFIYLLSQEKMIRGPKSAYLLQSLA